MIVLGEIETAIEYLRTSLELDPTNDRAADRLLEIVEPNDPAAAVEIIEGELTELDEARRPTSARSPSSSRGAPRSTGAPPCCGTITSAASIARCGTGSRRGSSSRSAPRRSRPRATCIARSATTRWSRKLYQAELEVLGKDGATAKQGADPARARSARAARQGSRGGGESPRRGVAARSELARDRRGARRGLQRRPGFATARRGTRPASCSSSSARAGSASATIRPASTICAARSASIRTRRRASQRARRGAAGQLAVGRARSHAAPPQPGRAGSRRARRGPAPARRAVSQPAARIARACARC